jgi:aquaporin NIP
MVSVSTTKLSYIIEFSFILTLLKVPAYMIAQVLGSTLASGTLRLIFNGEDDHFIGTLPAGSNLQAFVIEFICTFFLMFVITAVATDNRAVMFSTLTK